MDTFEEVPAIEVIESEVEERLETFVRAYVSEFEKKLEEYAREAEVGGTAKTGNIADKVVGPVAGAIGAAAGGLISGGAGASTGKGIGEKVIATGSKFFSGKNHRKRAKKTTQIFTTLKTDEQRKMLVEAASLIYYSFQNQFDSVTDADGNWKRALIKLAIDARNRSISYIYNVEKNLAIEELSKDLLTKGLILGKSKDSYLSLVTPKKMQQIIPGSKPGHTVIHEGKEWKTSDIYEKVGIKTVGSNGKTKYYKEKNCGNDYGYRWAFSWENGSSWISTYEEDCSNVSEDHRIPLMVEELEARMDQLLTNINKEDPKLQLNKIEGRVDETKETLETMKEAIVPIKQDLHEIKTKLSSELPKSGEPKVFTVKEPVKTFTGRKNQLTQLHDELQTQQKQVVVSQCASISGLGGMGKSELARKYAHTYHEYYGSCIWIDSETQSAITQSFNGLAEELQIPIQQKSFGGERNILLIVKDIYKRFSNSKSLFIFDNVNQYEEIKDFLPSNLSPTDEKPTIIITSRNSDWDIGDEGDVALIVLDQFTPEEALSFVKKVLEIKEEDTSHDSLISELTNELCCFPLALRQAASYIKTKKFLNSAIQSYLVEFRDQKKKKDLLQHKTKRDRYTETTYTTWQITFKNIEEHEANGPLAIRLVEIMAYLPADYILLQTLIALAENFEKLKEAVDILVKYSIITVKSIFEESDEESEEESDEESDEENDEGRDGEGDEEYEQEYDSKYFVYNNDAFIHRLVQQVIRLWLQDGKREEDVLRTALTQIHDDIDPHLVATLWSYACDYTTLINYYFCNIYDETKSYDQFVNLKYLIRDGAARTIRKILNYLEGRNDRWREISFIACRHNDVSMENTTHQTHIKAVLIFHAEVYNALKHSNTKDLELFLQSFDRSLINSWFEGITALQRSSECGKLNVVKILVENGADVNSYCEDSGHALGVSLWAEHPQVAEYLLDHGASTNDGAAFHSACFQGYLNIVKRLVNSIAIFKLDTFDYWESLEFVVQNDQVEIVEFLTNHEVYLSATIDQGQTLCSTAAKRGSIKVVKYLVDNKLANVNERDWRNETLLTISAINDQFDIVKYLLSDETPDKVDIDAHNVFGITPLFQAVLRGNVQIARFLIEHGAVVENVQNGNTLLGQLSISALHLAVAYNHIEMVKFLVEECNADINMGLNTTFSPLQVAKYFDSEEVCEFLIKHGADTTEWSEDKLENITCIFRNFCEENKKTDIVDDMFEECYSVLRYLNLNTIQHHNFSIDVELRFEILNSYLKKLQLDVRSGQGEE